jgi:proteasome activator subunit 4
MDSKNNNKKLETPRKAYSKFNESIDSDIMEYQNVNQFIKHLPYFDKIKANAQSEFERIRLNLSKTIALNEIRPGLVHWTNRLQTYINEYGLFFSKEDHLKLIKIYLEIIATRNIDLTIVDLCFSILIELLK